MEGLIVLIVLGILIMLVVGATASFKSSGASNALSLEIAALRKVMERNLASSKSSKVVSQSKPMQATTPMQAVAKTGAVVATDDCAVVGVVESVVPTPTIPVVPIAPTTFVTSMMPHQPIVVPLSEVKPLPIQPKTKKVEGMTHAYPYAYGRSPDEHVPKQDLPKPESQKFEERKYAFDAWLGEVFEVVRDWLCLTGRFAPEGLNREAALAVNWLIRGGICVVVLAVSFFLKWAIDQGIMPPAMRCGMVAIVGLALVIGGFRTRRPYLLLGEACVGIGTISLYASCYMTVAVYKDMGVPPALALSGMVIVTLGVGAMALYRNLPRLATVCVIGGCLAPVLLSDGGGDLLALSWYLGILGVLVVAGSTIRSWLFLPMVYSALSWAISLASMGSGQMEGNDLIWFGALHAIYLLSVLLNVVYHKRTVRVVNIVALLLNVFIFWFWLKAHYGFESQTCIWVTLALAAIYGGFLAIDHWRKLPMLRGISTGLSALFLAMAALAGLPDGWIVFAWVGIVLVLVEASLFTQDRITRWFAYFLLGVTCFRHAFFYWFLSDGFSNTAPFALSVMGSNTVSGLALIGCVGWMCWRCYEKAFAVLLGLLIWAFLSFDSWRWGTYWGWSMNAKMATLSVLWALYAIAGLVVGLVRDWASVRYCTLGLLGLTLLKVFMMDLGELSTGFRIVAALPVGLLLLSGAWLYLRYAPTNDTAKE